MLLQRHACRVCKRVLRPSGSVQLRQEATCLPTHRLFDEWQLVQPSPTKRSPGAECRSRECHAVDQLVSGPQPVVAVLDEPRRLALLRSRVPRAHLHAPAHLDGDPGRLRGGPGSSHGAATGAGWQRIVGSRRRPAVLAPARQLTARARSQPAMAGARLYQCAGCSRGARHPPGRTLLARRCGVHDSGLPPTDSMA